MNRSMAVALIWVVLAADITRKEIFGFYKQSNNYGEAAHPLGALKIARYPCFRHISAQAITLTSHCIEGPAATRPPPPPPPLNSTLYKEKWGLQDYFSYYCTKHRVLVLVRTASLIHSIF